MALVEFALLLPFLAIIVFGVLDLGRAWQLQNRLSNAAREGAAVAQFLPKSVASGCRSGNNVTDRAIQEEPGLSTLSGYVVAVEKIEGSTAQAITGCNTSSVDVEPGDTVRVSVSAEHDIITPLVGALTGDPITVTRSVDVVVQG